MRRRRRRSDADAAGGHLARSVHAQLVQYTRSWTQVRGQPFHQPRDVEKDIPAAVVRAEEAKTFGLEVGDYGSGLFAGGRVMLRRFGAPSATEPMTLLHLGDK